MERNNALIFYMSPDQNHNSNFLMVIAPLGLQNIARGEALGIRFMNTRSPERAKTTTARDHSSGHGQFIGIYSYSAKPSSALKARPMVKTFVS